MEIQGKTILVLGAPGLVGQAICKKLIEEKVGKLILASLYPHEVEALKKTIKEDYGKKSPAIEITSGNYLARHEWKNLSKSEVLSNKKIRQQWIGDAIEPLTKEVLQASEMYHLCKTFRPDVIIDAVNFATALSYQDIFGASKEVLSFFNGSTKGECSEEMALAIDKLLITQYTPQVIRHVQILFQSMVENKTEFYLKIGTSGSGGMGLNIPYTHSEDKPSQTLLAKCAIAGAHSLLLFLMARTPGGPIIKEIKPTAAIAWKRIGFGTIKNKGKEIFLEKVQMKDALVLKGELKKKMEGKPKYTTPLESPFIDTGENGLFALGEFEVLTDEGQMEFITPEEIAQTAIWEIMGRNTGKDIIAALDNSTMGPTYRAGYMRDLALTLLREEVEKHQVDSIAFEQLGPPRLSKILYEAYLLKINFQTLEKFLAASPKEAAKKLEATLDQNEKLLSQIISIGIPILLCNGNQWVRGSRIVIPADIPGRPDASFKITPASTERWAHDGWVDLTPKNVKKWQERVRIILKEITSHSKKETSSATSKETHYWSYQKGNTPIQISKLAGWIITNEEQGFRMKT